jgi:tetratricopeptide (TPR) repeat protein
MRNVLIIVGLLLILSCKNQKTEKELYELANAQYDSGKDSLCILSLDELIGLYPSNSEAIYLRAFANHRSGKMKEAITDYSKYIELEQNYDEAWYFRGVAKYQINDSTAIDDYNKTIELNPDFGEAYNNRAIIYLNKNEKENACKDLKSAQKLGIKNADSLILKYCNSH